MTKSEYENFGVNSSGEKKKPQPQKNQQDIFDGDLGIPEIRGRKVRGMLLRLPANAYVLAETACGKKIAISAESRNGKFFLRLHPDGLTITRLTKRRKTG